LSNSSTLIQEVKITIVETAAAAAAAAAEEEETHHRLASTA
jgi:hypothetical protein